MSYWDTKEDKLVHRDPYPAKNSPGWVWLDCYCDQGMQWNNNDLECDDCQGVGWRCVCIATGKVATFPGATPFGTATSYEYAEALTINGLALELSNTPAPRPINQSRSRIRSYCLLHRED